MHDETDGETDDDFAWVQVDASGILGSARPKDVTGLLKKPALWHELYAGWLAVHHPAYSGGWDYLAHAGGRPRLHGRKEYDQWVAVLDADFVAFLAAIGRLKAALDSRKGTSRRLAHLTGRAAGAAREAARSTHVTRAAAAVGAQGLQKAATGAANQVGKLVGVSGPQSAPAPDPPARRFAGSPDLDNYLAWLAHLRQEMDLYGGVLAEYAARLDVVAQNVVVRRGELRASVDVAAARTAAYWLGYSIDLWDLPVPPHHRVVAVVNDLHERGAHALYLQLHPLLGPLVESIETLYDCGLAALGAAGGLIDTGQFQLATLRAELPGLLPDPRWDARPAEADETAAREVFGRSYSDFAS